MPSAPAHRRVEQCLFSANFSRQRGPRSTSALPQKTDLQALTSAPQSCANNMCSDQCVGNTFSLMPNTLLPFKENKLLHTVLTGFLYEIIMVANYENRQECLWRRVYELARSGDFRAGSRLSSNCVSRKPSLKLFGSRGTPLSVPK